MNLWDVQTYAAQLIEAHPVFAARRVTVILDDGTYPKIPGLERQLRERGLAIIVWRVGSLGLIDTNRTGVSNQILHVPVVIQENEAVNRKPLPDGFPGWDQVGQDTPLPGTQILPEQALQYVLESVSGNPKNTPPGTPLLPHHEPFSNLGKVNGVWTIVVNFAKHHRVTPL